MGVTLEPRTIALNTRLTKEQTRAFIKECPLQDYDALTRKPRLAQQAERINQTLDEEEQRRLEVVAAVPLSALHPVP